MLKVNIEIMHKFVSNIVALIMFGLSIKFHNQTFWLNFYLLILLVIHLEYCCILQGISNRIGKVALMSSQGRKNSNVNLILLFKFRIGLYPSPQQRWEAANQHSIKKNS